MYIPSSTNTQHTSGVHLFGDDSLKNEAPRQKKLDDIQSSKGEEPGCMSATWSWMTNALSTVWGWITWICCCGFLNGKTSVKSIIDSPESTGKAVAKDPIGQLSQLIDSFLDDPTSILDLFQPVNLEKAEIFIESYTNETSAVNLPPELKPFETKIPKVLFQFLHKEMIPSSTLIGKLMGLFMQFSLVSKNQETRLNFLKTSQISSIATALLKGLSNAFTKMSPELVTKLGKISSNNSELQKAIAAAKKLFENLPILLNEYRKFENPFDLHIQYIKNPTAFLSNDQVKTALQTVKENGPNAVSALKKELTNVFMTGKNLEKLPAFELLYTIHSNLGHEATPVVSEIKKFIGNDWPLATMLFEKIPQILALSPEKLEKMTKAFIALEKAFWIKNNHEESSSKESL